MASPYSSTAPAPAAPGPDRTTTVRDPAPEPGTDRALGRRPGVPGGRALIGAALVVAAAVMTYAAYVGATSPPSRTYVVAARDLQPNERLAAGDLAVVHGDLPPEVTDQAFASKDELEGAIVLAPLPRNGLIPRRAVVSGPDAAPSPGFEVSFTTPEWKLGGSRVQAGELIDLVPVSDQSDNARSSPVRGVRVVARTGGDLGQLGGSPDITVTVAAADQATYQAIVNVVRGDYFIVRATGATAATGAPGGATGSAGAAGSPNATWPGTGGSNSGSGSQSATTSAWTLPSGGAGSPGSTARRP